MPVFKSFNNRLNINDRKRNHGAFRSNTENYQAKFITILSSVFVSRRTTSIDRRRQLFFFTGLTDPNFWQMKIMILISHINIYFSLLLIFHRIWSFSESWSKVMWSISYVNCVDIITQVSLIQRIIFFDVPTLNLGLSLLFCLPTDPK